MLDLTPKEVVERQALRVNPAKTCQPIGAMYAALGIHRCLPHSHGSQGCCAYHRSHLTRHFKEPVMAATSSFTEGASVFGGAANLTQAINTIFTVYKPDVIAVHTTCLSETIGDDIPTIIAKSIDDGHIPEGKFVFHANTPSYVGSHVTGFSNMTKAMATRFPERTGVRKDQVNIIPGWVEPSDMRHLKRLMREMGVNPVMFPDTSDVLDTPQMGKYAMYPKGGITIDKLKTAGDSIATLALGSFASQDAGAALDNKCGVPCEVLDLPIGLSATDRFIHTLKDVAGVAVPTGLMDDRGRLIDIMGDMTQHLFGKKVAIAGDPDQMLALTEFLLDLNMKPVHIVTGTPGSRFEKRIRAMTATAVPNVNVKAFGDLFLLHQWIKNEGVDLIIGNSYCKYIARAEDIPFVRFGWPILDRTGHQYFPTTGYRGAMHLLTKILDAVLDRRDRDAPEERFELVM